MSAARSSSSSRFSRNAGQKLLEDELLPEFYKKYPEVKVNVDYTTYGKLNEKLTTSIVGEETFPT